MLTFLKHCIHLVLNEGELEALVACTVLKYLYVSEQHEPHLGPA